MEVSKRIIATSWHPGGANAISPVIKRLNKEGKVDVITIGHQYSEKIFQDGGINYKTIDFYELSDVSTSSMDQILQEESPDLVFTGTGVQNKYNRHVIDQALTAVAQRRGIKSLAVSDFWDFLGNYCQRFSDIYTDNGRFRFLPDRIAIMDKLAEEAMLKEGFPREKLIITGNPYFDELVELKENFGERDRRKVRNDLHIDLNAYLFAYFSQPIWHHYGEELGYTEKTALKELLDSLKKLQDKKKIGILVKAHPRENKHDIEQVTKEYDLPIKVDQDYPTRPTILAADAIISPFSTVLIESTYLDKPTISLQPGLKKEDLLITNRMGITVPVYEHGKIDEILEKLLFDKNFATELSQRAKRKGFTIDGKATERVTNLIYEMIK